MLELYQFELSHYVEKVRLILDYKGLPYQKIEVTPGIGQLELIRLSGQRQVPVLKDGNTVIADSTAIAEYLDKQYPEKPVIPSDPKLRGLCMLMEQWADDCIGLNARKALIVALNKNLTFRTALLPNYTPDIVRTLVTAIPSEVFNFLGQGVGLGPDAMKRAEDELKHALACVCFILNEQPYLVTDHPTLADFAVAGLSMYIKFPTGNYLNIPEAAKGQGVPDIAEVGTFAPFFQWRDKLYADYRQASATAAPPAGGRPTAIDIE